MDDGGATGPGRFTTQAVGRCSRAAPWRPRSTEVGAEAGPGAPHPARGGSRDTGMVIRLHVRADVDDGALSRLHASAFDGPYRPTARGNRLRRHSLTWITAHDVDDRLVGFVNVAWDGGSHAFLLDTMVESEARQAGVGTALVQSAAGEAAAAGCEWLHVDFEEQLSAF